MEINFFNILILLIIIIEILIFLIILFIKKDFQWILTNKDEKPKIDDKKLENFLNSNYSEKTGWDRKPNTRGSEYSGNNKSNFIISKHGYRESTNSFKDVKYLVFGDSFAFCRYVNDNETWEYYLENLLQKNIRNYGVGNFGVDQAILKYINLPNNNEANHIILSFVPETILRVHSYWKHYVEFGNIYGFKPKFKYVNNKLELLPNILKKNYKAKDVISKIEYIKSNDIFYKKRFQKFMFKFPYLLSYIKNINRNNIIFFNILVFKFLKFLKIKKSDIYLKKAQYKIVKDNIELSHKLYGNSNFTILMEKIILNFNLQLKQKNKKISLIIFPQIQDLESPKKQRYLYQSFFKSINKHIQVIDLTDSFLNYGDYKSLYVNDSYGGHLSPKGNKFVANIINEKLI